MNTCTIATCKYTSQQYMWICFRRSACTHATRIYWKFASHQYMNIRSRHFTCTLATRSLYWVYFEYIIFFMLYCVVEDSLNNKFKGYNVVWNAHEVKHWHEVLYASCKLGLSGTMRRYEIELKSRRPNKCFWRRQSPRNIDRHTSHCASCELWISESSSTAKPEVVITMRRYDIEMQIALCHTMSSR